MILWKASIFKMSTVDIKEFVPRFGAKHQEG